MDDDSPEAAWCAGVMAGRAGLAADTNPYPAETALALDWEGGWSEGDRIGPEPRKRPKTTPPTRGLTFRSARQGW